MSLIFRTMLPTDFPACANELIAAFREEPWNETWTYEQAIDRIDEIMSARVSRGFVCMDGDKCVSMLCGRIMTYQDKKQFWIDEFSVHPDMQRQGVGSQMLSVLREQLQQESQTIHYMALNTERGFPSVTFYEKNGFIQLESDVCMAGHVRWP